MLEALNLKNNAETRYRCQVSVYRTIGPLVCFAGNVCVDDPSLYLLASLCSIWGKNTITSRKHHRTKVTPDFHLTYSKNGGNLGSELKLKKWIIFNISP